MASSPQSSETSFNNPTSHGYTHRDMYQDDGFFDGRQMALVFWAMGIGFVFLLVVLFVVAAL